MIREVTVLVAIGCGLNFGSAAASRTAADSSRDYTQHLAALQTRATSKELHRDPVWQLLLQMPPGSPRAWTRSSATSEAFFLSPKGRTDPEAELRATLASFFDLDAVVKDVEHPQCAFIARRHWLIERLQIGEEEMPLLACEHYEDWRRGLAATGLTLIYPEGFMNNPASMFGHTLLRIDVAGEDAAGELLGYAVDFTGEAGTDGGLKFIAKGVLGLYPGRFGIHPYYQQLRRYAEWENRDIWEYRLNTTQDELGFALMHLWELRGIDHPYYFFTENCSYHLLRLLELVNPELRRRDAMPTFVIPVDTVRETLAADGFVGEVRYRPSPARKLEFRLSNTDPFVARIAKQIAEGTLAPTSLEIAALADPDRAAALDIAYELLRYSFVQGTRAQAHSQGLARRILVARSKIKLPEGSPAPLVPVAPPIRPDEGHASATASIVGGYRDDESYVDFQLRPAFQGLMASEGGYPQNMQIRFFDVNVRYFPERSRVRLEELTLIEAVSLSPRTEVYQPYAWNLLVGLATRRVKDGGRLEDAAVARGDIGGGFAFEPWTWMHVYALASATVDAGPGLEHDVSLGPGVRSGVYLRGPEDLFKSHFFADFRSYVVGDTSQVLRAGTQQRVSLSTNVALVLEGTYNRTEGTGYFAGEFGLMFHF